MEKILRLDQRIDSDFIDKLISFLNDSEGYDKIFYLSSRGGNVSDMIIAADLINKQGNKIVLIAYNQIASCGFELFFICNCPKIILPDTIGMFHQSTVMVELNEHGKPSDKEEDAKLVFMQTNMARRTNDLIDYIGISSEEENRIRRGEDVWFTTQRLLEFLKKSGE